MEILNIKVPFKYTPVVHSYKGWALYTKEFRENVEPFITSEFFRIFREYSTRDNPVGRSPMLVDKSLHKWEFEIHSMKNIEQHSFFFTYEVDKILCRVIFEIEKPTLAFKKEK